MMDPFRNRKEVDKRRIGLSGSKIYQRSKASNILDFLVLGALCAICGQAVCIDEVP